MLATIFDFTYFVERFSAFAINWRVIILLVFKFLKFFELDGLSRSKMSHLFVGFIAGRLF